MDCFESGVGLVAVWKNEISAGERRRFWLFTADGTFHYTGQSLFDPGVLVPALVSCLTTSPYLIGLGTASRYAGWYLPQLVVAGFSQRRLRKKPIILLGGLIRALGILAIIPAMALFFHRAPSIALVLFFVLYSASSIGEGISGLAWVDVVGKCITSTRRGRLMSYMQVLGGIGALAASGVVAWVLSRPWLAVPTNYSILMFLFFLCIMGSFAMMYLLEEPEGDPPQAETSFRRYLRNIPSIVRSNPQIKRFLAAKMLANCYMLSVPFYVTFARVMLGIPDSLMGGFIGSQMLGTMIGSVLLGHTGDACGNRWVIRLGIIASLCAPAIGVTLWGFYPVLPGGAIVTLLLALYFFLGAGYSGLLIGFQNYLLELVEPGIRPTCIGLSNTLVAPICLAPLLGGYILKSLESGWLFGITAFLVLAAFLVSLGMEEPRVRQG